MSPHASYSFISKRSSSDPPKNNAVNDYIPYFIAVSKFDFLILNVVFVIAVILLWKARARNALSRRANSDTDDTESLNPVIRQSRLYTSSLKSIKPEFDFSEKSETFDLPKASSSTHGSSVLTKNSIEGSVAIAIDENDYSECLICFERLLPNDKCREIPCDHLFHQPCLDKWLLTRTCFCPTCRYDLSRSCQEKHEIPQSSTESPSSTNTDSSQVHPIRSKFANIFS
ncbi:hypothetical protein BB560_000063 [Smittium megazygosporum]|uniref:RING-type E3 ubiquitin transferase n=1 Tax=Smittium megazygosporum TaxID=133381 RepID=A0A2T9ZLF6_9FUNG|nr:hypothetical protein BB560_000063 [Smittium megazygosporum]